MSSDVENRADHKTASLFDAAISLAREQGDVAGWAWLLKHEVPSSVIFRVLDGPRRAVLPPEGQAFLTRSA